MLVLPAPAATPGLLVSPVIAKAAVVQAAPIIVTASIPADNGFPLVAIWHPIRPAMVAGVNRLTGLIPQPVIVVICAVARVVIGIVIHNSGPLLVALLVRVSGATGLNAKTVPKAR